MSTNNWYCAICGLWSSDCEKNHLCPRNIINKKKQLTIDDRTYFSFSDVTSAMKEYAALLYKTAHTTNRKVLTEKFNIYETLLDSNY